MTSTAKVKKPKASAPMAQQSRSVTVTVTRVCGHVTTQVVTGTAEQRKSATAALRRHTCYTCLGGDFDLNPTPRPFSLFKCD